MRLSTRLWQHSCLIFFSVVLFFGFSLHAQSLPNPPSIFIDTIISGANVSGNVLVGGWAIDNTAAVGTAIASVQIKVDGVAVAPANYGSPRSDVCAVYVGRPGCPNVGFWYSLNTSNLSLGSHTITACATDTDPTPDTGCANVTVNVQPTLPSIFIDTIISGASVSGNVLVGGWAIDNISAVGTAIASVQIKVDGATVAPANYGSPRPDVCAVYPGRPGCPNVGFAYLLDTNNLSSGPHTITACATDTDPNPDTGCANVTVNIQPTLLPSIFIDTIISGANVSGNVLVGGWAIDNTSVVGTAIASVQIKVDGAAIAPANYGSPRPDVCVVYPGRPGCPNVGFWYSLNTSNLSLGSHTITACATDTDPTPDTGCANVTVNVQPALPSIFIDTIHSGANVSGDVLVGGWAIDNISTVGTAIASVQIKVDGVVVGTANYGSLRTDVCAVYPGRPGCPNVGFAYLLDTSNLSSGPHTITGCATNSAQNPLTGCQTISVNAIAPLTLPTPGTVAPTQHPLVAQYSVSVPTGAQVTVEFGTDLSYGRTTSSQSVPTGGGTVSFLVAGMRPNTTYHMRAQASMGGGAIAYDIDHTFTSGSMPASFPAVTVTPAGKSPSGGVELLSALAQKITSLVVDTDGTPIWYYYDPTVSTSLFAFPIRQIDNGHFLVQYLNEVREVDLTGTIVRDLTLSQLNTALSDFGSTLVANVMHHDILSLSNGHWILLVQEVRDFQNLPGYPGTTQVLGDAVVDLDPNNQVVWVWRAFDHLDVNRHPFMFPDWTHSNGLAYTPDGNLLLSMRHQSWVIKIDYANGSGAGDILWRLGPQGDFTLSDTDPAAWFYNEHFPILLPSDTLRLALYDNGDTRPDSTGQPCYLNVSNTCYSRAVVLDLNEDTLQAQISWQYVLPWYSFWGGSIVQLPDGNMEFDSTTVNGGFSRVLETTGGASPQVIWQMDVSNADFYRGYRIPSLYPGVQW